MSEIDKNYQAKITDKRKISLKRNEAASALIYLQTFQENKQHT